MSDFDCLSIREVRELTGTPIKARQFKFLRLNGIRHFKGLDGRPRVPRSAVETQPSDTASTWVPNKAA